MVLMVRGCEDSKLLLGDIQLGRVMSFANDRYPARGVAHRFSMFAQFLVCWNWHRIEVMLVAMPAMMPMAMPAVWRAGEQTRQKP